MSQESDDSIGELVIDEGSDISEQIISPMQTRSEDSHASKSSSDDSSLYKTPQNSPQSAQYRTAEENNAENTESPSIIVASHLEDINEAVTTKDSSTQDSGETLAQRNKPDSQDMAIQTSASQADNKSSKMLTEDSIDLEEEVPSHIQLVFEKQGSEDSDYSTPPSSPERNAEIDETQVPDDDYFQNLRSPRSDEDESIDHRSEHTEADFIEDINNELQFDVIEEDESFLAAVSSARAANMQMFIDRSKTCTKIEDKLRYQVIKNLFSTDNEELQQMATWKPVIPELEDDETEERKAPPKRTELPPPSPKKKKNNSSQASAEISSQSQNQQMSEAEENWSQEVHSGISEESQSSRARPFIPEDAFLERILKEDPSQKSATNLKQRISDFLFPSKRSPPKNKRKRSKSSDKSENNTSKRAAVKTSVLNPSADITVPRRPGRDALSDITDLSSAFDNDSPIRVRKLKAKQTRLEKRSDQPTCSKYFQAADNSSDEEQRAPISLRRKKQKDSAKLPKMTKLKSATKSRAISKLRIESSSRKKAGKQDTVVRKSLRSINSSLETRDPREVFEEVAITIKDVKNIEGKIGLTFDTEKSSLISVKEVVAGSPADISGFKAGDIIVSFNRTRCSYKSRVTLSVFLCLFTESEETDFDFVVVRDLPDTFSAGEASDADTSEISDISDMKHISNVISQDADNTNIEEPNQDTTNPVYETFDVTANTSAFADSSTLKTKRPKRKRKDISLAGDVTNEEGSETTNRVYETFDVSENNHASNTEKTFDASLSDISYNSSAAEKVKQRVRKIGLTHYINPRPESIASRKRNQSDSDDDFMSAISSPASTRGQQKTTSSKMSMTKKRRRWDYGEDANLIIGLNRYGTDWAKIKAKLFSSSERTNVNIKDRHRQLLKEGDSRVKKNYN
ncbi:unnamed protein product [Oikopleura dioica]|uniref:PDZ domain-containing protein n=1 Tax=Oikopleura dioica TaxID=34765 RepID=E4XJR5_OIKDI|nr:unnamed protein product [Oikopleura dioica]